MVTVQEYWPVVRWLQYKNIGPVVDGYSTIILASGKNSTRILASGKVVTAQEYWPVVRWLQYKNIGQW